MKNGHLSNEAGTIFLTGATGLVGRLLLQHLTEQNPHRTIIALAHSLLAVPQQPNTCWITGDISEPGLGLPKDLYSQLCESVETIIHCAASTKFTLPLYSSRKVNLHGTENMLALARRTKRLKRLLHVSTVYIAGRKSGELQETEFTSPEGWFSFYEQSKFEAEKWIVDTAHDLPWTIVRPSTIVGNSRTGTISQFNYFHQLLRLVPSSPLPVIPGTPDAPVDMVADDWVVEGLAAILNGNPAGHSIFHLCAGPSQALPAQEVVEMAFRLHRVRQPESVPQMPRLIPVEEFQAFAKALRRTGQTALSRIADLLLLYLPHLGVHQPFLNGNTNHFLESVGMSPPCTREYLPRIIESCW